MTTAEFNKISKIEFTKLSNANSFAEHCHKQHLVLLGDNGKFWVANFRNAERLHKAGYELAA